MIITIGIMLPGRQNSIGSVSKRLLIKTAMARKRAREIPGNRIAFEIIKHTLNGLLPPTKLQLLILPKYFYQLEA